MMDSKYFRYQFIMPMLLSIALLWQRYTIPGPSFDGVTYLQISRNILNNHELGWQALWAPPLHSILTAVVSRLMGIRDLLAAVSIVSPLMAFLLIPTVYFLALQIFDRRTALIASTVAAISPHLLYIAYSTEPEITYTFFLTLSLAIFTAAVIRNSLTFAAFAGMSFSWAYLSRSEGFLVMVLVFLGITLVQGKKICCSGVLKLCAVATVMFFMTSLPYLLFLKQHYGAWVISPKASYVLIWTKSLVYKDDNKEEMTNPDLWGLNSEGKLHWQEPRGLGELADFLMSHPEKSASVYLRNLSSEIPGRIPNNSGMESYPQVFPVYFVGAALLAIFMPWGSLAREKRVILLCPLLVLFILPIFCPGWWKYMVPYLPILIVMASKGLVGGTRFLAERINVNKGGTCETVALSLVIAVIAGHFYLALYPKSVAAPDEGRSNRVKRAEEQQKAGKWAAQRFGPGKNYMVAWDKIIYYLDGYWTALPMAMEGEILAYARKNKVDYLVVQKNGNLYDLQEVMKSYPAFELVDHYQSETSWYVVGFYRPIYSR